MSRQAKAITEGKIELFVPGRLCLFGEHSDWSGQLRKFNAGIFPGQALVVCTEEGIYAEAQADNMLEITTVDAKGQLIFAKFAMDEQALRQAAGEGGFFSYIAGVAAYMLNYHHIGGLKINCTKMTLPQKKGLSSSAAICTLTARAFNRIYGLNLTVRGEMECAYGGEQLTPSRCGRLDQAVAYGRGIVKMTFDGDRLDVTPVRVGAPLYFVFADLKAEKDTLTILRDLNAAFPYPQTEAHNRLHKFLGAENAQIVDEVVRALECGDAMRVGAQMNHAQTLFRESAAPLSAKELASPKLYEVLNDKNIREWSYGGKGVGSQGDGSVQFIAKGAEEAERLKHYLAAKWELDCYSVTVQKTSAVRKAVIPLGGYGTRMYPATKVNKKDFLPVVDFDGLVKPMLLILLETLIQNGIEEICLVIRPGEEDLYYRLFEKLPEQNLRKLPKTLRAFDEGLSKFVNRITYSYQPEPFGFGHAVLQSERFANHEPVMVLLGDHLFSSDSETTCFGQLLSAFEQSKTLSLGLFELSEEEVSHYGIAKVKDERNGLLDLLELVEKPTGDLRDLSYNGKYYGIFMYIINPQVYEALSNGFSQWDGSSGEFQFTTALDEVTRKCGAIGAVINGKRYDVGLPEQYRKTISEYGRRNI